MKDKKNSAGDDAATPKRTGQKGSSRSQAKKDEMRELASQAVANAPGLEDRIAQAKGMVTSNPLRADPHAQVVDANGAPSGGTSTPASKATPAAAVAGGPARSHIASPRGYYELVELGLIVENPFNARKTYRESRIQEMKASLAANGQETPGTATIRDGKYVLAAGHYRFKGLKLLDAPHMGLMIIPGLSDKALYEMSYRENAEREDQTAYDNALAWRDLLDTKVYQTEQELAGAIGMSAPNVNKTLGILRLSETIRKLIAEDPTRFALSVLYELALFESVGGTARAMTLAQAVANGDIGRQQIQDARAQLEDKKPRKERETTRQYKMKVGETSEGTLKEWPSGKVAFEVKIEDPAARAKFVAEMRQRFESAE